MERALEVINDFGPDGYYCLCSANLRFHNRDCGRVFTHPIPEKGRGEGKQRDATEIPPSCAENDPRPYRHVGAEKNGHKYVKRR